jgi:hypothetical protein
MTFEFATSAEDLMRALVGRLTQPQRRALVESLIVARMDSDVVLVDGNERSVSALIRHQPPLIVVEGRRRYLSPLGLDMARFLYATGEFRL